MEGKDLTGNFHIQQRNQVQPNRISVEMQENLQSLARLGINKIKTVPSGEEAALLKKRIELEDLEKTETVPG